MAGLRAVAARVCQKWHSPLYGKRVSPFFKRKKFQPKADEPAVAQAPAEQAQQAEQAPDLEESAPAAAIPAPEPTRSREELLDAAYRAWHAELAARAQQADEVTSDEANGVIDLTHPHPTGAVAFASGSAVRITSLIRENVAQREALANLRRLQATTRRISEMYGHAPVSLSVGRLTWSELPSVPKSEAPAAPTNVEFAELTGEFIIDNDGSLVSVDTDGESSATFGGRADDADGAAHADTPGDARAEDPADAHRASSDEQAGVQAAEPAGEERAVEREPRQAVVVKEPALYRSVAIEFEEGDAAVRQLNHTMINPAYLRALRENGATAEQLAELTGAAASMDLEQVLELVAAYGRNFLPGFDFENEMLLGCFERPERTMLADLEAMEPYIRTSGIMMALAGDEETRRLSAAPLPPGGEEDRAPEVERGAGDLDVAELNVVEAVASGRSIVVDCPPGSQRVQTVASICADAAASKRSVVVVPSRLSSGRQLIAELERLGLGDLVLDFSAVEKVPQRIRTGLRLATPELPTEDTLQLRGELVSARRQLEAFVGDLHRVDEDWGTSIHGLLEKLAGLMAKPDAPQTRVRLGKTAVAAMKRDGIEAITADLDQAAELGAFDPAISRSAWAGSTISNAADGQSALDAVRRLNDITVPAAISQSSRSAGETAMKQPKTLGEWFEQIDVLDGIADSLDTFLPVVFETSPMNLAIATAPKQWREAHGHSMKMSDRRRYRKQALDMVRPGESTATLHEELLKVQQRREVWRRYSPEGGWPTLPDGLTQIRATRSEVQRDLESLQSYLGGESLLDMDFDSLQARLAALVADAGHMATLPERNATLASLRERGLGEFIEDIANRQVAPARIAAELDLAFTSAVFEEMIRTTPAVASFGPSDLTRLLDRFRQLDRAHTRTLWGPVLRAVVNNAREAMQSRRQDTLRLDEILAEQGLSGLRDAIATYSRLVQSARPVWVVPPNVLAEFIPPMPWADLVLVEATDLVAPLISPMMRGRQAVVVSDLRRPDAEAVRVFDEVLPVATLPTLRAEHDALSAHALKEIGYELSAIPSVRASRESRLIYVDGRGVPGISGDGAVESTQVEVEAVVDAVIEHAVARPGETLAVIALSVLHASRIRDALVAADSSDVHRLKDFVITDITRAAGLRYDHVILSVGYGKTVHGRVLHTFGALATPAGLAGLIDTIAAAGSDLTIISALGPGDIDTRRVSTPGPKLLARLIENSAGADVSATFDDAVTPLLADVAQRLGARGWQTRADYGYEGCPRIPLAVGKDGRFTVAVVLDDEAYVAERSLRRRDRFWIETLQAHGWSVFQTFSSSLFIDPAGQADAIEALLMASFGTPGAPVQVPIVDDDGTAVRDPERSDELTTSIGLGAAIGAGAVAATGADAEPVRVARPRGPRPEVVPGLSLAAYSDDQLDDMTAWIASDGLVRGEDDFVHDLRSELGITRRGEQVDVILRNVARRSGLVGVAVEASAYVAPEAAAEAVAETAAEPVAEEVAVVELAAEQSEDPAQDLIVEVAEPESLAESQVTVGEEPEHGVDEPAPGSVAEEPADGPADEPTDEPVDEPAVEEMTEEEPTAHEKPATAPDDPLFAPVDYEIVEERTDDLDLGDEDPFLSGDND